MTGDDLKEYVGRSLLPSEWMTITQERINDFADVTDDHQFIHVDEAAARATPLGSTIAHGFLTLSLLSVLKPPDWPVLENTEMVFNSGLDKLRFLQPVKAGSRVRIHNKNTKQAYLCLSVPGLPRDHPDRLNLRLLNTVLGGGMSSRLFNGIREKRGEAWPMALTPTSVRCMTLE